MIAVMGYRSSQKANDNDRLNHWWGHIAIKKEEWEFSSL